MSAAVRTLQVRAASEPAARDVSVLCIQTSLLGNVTYGLLLRQLFSNAPGIDFRAVWSNETRAILPRAMNRALTYPGRIGPARFNLDMWGTRFEFAASRLARTVTLGALRQRSADVLHFHTQGIAWQSLDLMRRIPTLISADMTAIQSAEQETLADWRWTHRPRAILEGRAFRSASAVVAFSRWAARSIQDVHGVDQHRIFVIHPGIRRSEFQAFHSRDQVETVDECRVLFVGGEFERKGGPLLVDVFLKHLVATGAKLDIVTKSPVVFDHPQIRVHRNIAPFSDAWRRLYAKASLLVVPTFRDASSHASIEAMAAGLPVVTTRIGGIPEIVVEGDNGFLIEPGDGALLTQRILALIGDRPLRVRMGAAGKGRVEKYFDAEKNASYLASLYARIYSERRSTVVVEERDINKAYAQD